MARITGADHTSFTVADVRRSAAFYCDLLGFEVIHERPEVRNEYFRKIVGLPELHVHAFYLRIPGTSHCLELFEYKRPPGTPLDLMPNNPGASHLAYFVDDLRELYATLKAAEAQYGHSFVSEPIYLDEGPNVGGWALYMRDPNGILIELFQPARKD